MQAAFSATGFSAHKAPAGGRNIIDVCRRRLQDPCALLCAPPRRYTAGYEYAEPTECEVRANSRLPRDLLQQRADPRERVGFLPGFRDHAAKLGDAGGITKLSGHLSQPATGQGAHGALAAERVELRSRVRRDQA